MSETTTSAPAQRLALSSEEANKISQAYVRLNELGTNVLVAKETDAERKAILRYLGESFQKYGGEFLGCWHTLHKEYEPFLAILATLFDRVDDVRAYKQQMLDARNATTVATEKAP